MGKIVSDFKLDYATERIYHDNTGLPVSGLTIGASATLTINNGANLTVSAIATGSGNVTTSTSHGLSVGDSISFSALTGGTGITLNQVYYVLTAPSATTFTFSATRGGAVVAPSVAATAATIVIGHNYDVGDPIVLSGTQGTLGGLIVGTRYYVASITPNSNTLTLSATVGGAAITTTGAYTANNLNIVSNVVWTANQLYTMLQDTVDELAPMAYDVPISGQTPTDYTLINGWFLDDEDAIKYLKGGSIKTSGWDAVPYGTGSVAGGIYKVFFGATYTNAVASDIGKTVVGTGITGTLLYFDNTKKEWYIRRLTGATATWTAASALALTITAGTGAGTMNTAPTTGENLYSNVYTLGTLEAGTSLYVEQAGAVLVPYWDAGHIDLLLPVKEQGALVNSGLARVFSRMLSDSYSHYQIDLSSGGRNPVPLQTANDLDNQTAPATLNAAPYTTMTQTFAPTAVATMTIAAPAVITLTAHGLALGDQVVFSTTGALPTGVVAGTTYYVAGTVAANTFNISATSGGANITTSGTQSGVHTADAYFSRNLNNGAGVKPYKAAIDAAAQTVAKMYEHLKYITQTGQVGLLNGVQGQLYRAAVASYAEVTSAPFGTFAGGKFFGARAVWITNYDAADAKNFQLIDAANAVQNPPNVVPVKVTGVVVGDRVSVFRLTGVGGTIKNAEHTITTATNATSSVVVSVAIPSDTPPSGVLRMVVSGNVEHRYAYSSWTGSTFTLSSPLTQTYTGNCYVPLVDEQATATLSQNSLTYSADIPVRIRVRNSSTVGSKILPFEVDGTVSATGLSVSAIRTADSIAA